MNSVSKKSDLPHSNFWSIYLASAASGQPFKVFKDVSIVDPHNFGIEATGANLIQLEFTPQQPNEPLVVNDFWCDIEENQINRTLHFKLRKEKDNGDKTKNPYVLKLSFYSKTKINFKVDCTPHSTASEYLHLLLTLKKINDLEYRRIYFEDGEGNRILTSSCPKIDYTIKNIELKVLEKVVELDQKLQVTLPIPSQLDDRMLSRLEKIIDEYGSVDNSVLVNNYNEININEKITLIEVILPIENDKGYPRRLISYANGWIKYKSLGINTLPSRVHEWNEASKNRDPIMLNMNLKKFNPAEVFNLLREDKDVLSKVFEIYHKVNTLENQLRTSIQIYFEKPTGNVQNVKILIENIDEKWNVINELYLTKNYVKMIPYLEDLEIEDPTLAYAYVLNKQYDKAIDLAKKIIKDDIRSIAHMTLGLAYIGKENYEAAYQAYLLGKTICSDVWYPIARDNFLDFLKSEKIEFQNDDDLIKINNLLSENSTSRNLNSKCYCGSKKKLKNCHANPQRFD